MHSKLLKAKLLTNKYWNGHIGNGQKKNFVNKMSLMGNIRTYTPNNYRQSLGQWCENFRNIQICRPKTRLAPSFFHDHDGSGDIDNTEASTMCGWLTREINDGLRLRMFHTGTRSTSFRVREAVQNVIHLWSRGFFFVCRATINLRLRKSFIRCAAQ